MAGTPDRRTRRTRRQPERSCVACRQTRSKRELIRIVREPSGTVSLDPTRKLSGRGTYLCASHECWERGAVNATLQHHLRLEKPLSDNQLAALRDQGRTVIASAELPVAKEKAGA